jgi:hypothetical protein
MRALVVDDRLMKHFDGKVLTEKRVLLGLVGAWLPYSGSHRGRFGRDAEPAALGGFRRARS